MSPRPLPEEETEDDVIARAQQAWDEGRPEDAARILEEYVAERPERAEAIQGKGFAGPGVEAAPRPPGTLPCLRCDAPMPYRRRIRLHSGNNLAPVILGDLGELFVGILDYDTYACPECGHVEFFLPGKAKDVRRRGGRGGDGST